MIFNTTGGGTSLNFKVVGGTTQPESPTENSIWVNTSVSIPSWAFSATEPESPVEGMVWIATGIASGVAFNALKKNDIQVYPMSAKQYVSGQWESVEVKTYQNGEFVDWWDGYYYKAGNEVELITGGWSISGVGTKYSSYLFIGSETEVLDATGTATHSKTIDLTNVNTIYFHVVKASNNTSGGRIRVNVLTESGSTAATTSIINGTTTTVTNEEITIDVSNLTGLHTIAAVTRYSHASTKRIVYMTIDNIWGK